MLRRKVVAANQKVTSADFTDFGIFPKETFDALGYGLLIPDAAFWGFPVINQGTTLLVGSGYFIKEGVTYYNTDEGGASFDLLPKLPVSARRYWTLAVYGQEMDAAEQPRTFLIDATTRATEAQVTPTERVRRAQLDLVGGQEGLDPVPPAVPSDALAIADILLDTSGVVSITMREDNRAPSLRTLDTLTKAFDAWRIRIGALLDTLASDLAALAGRIGGLATRAMVIEVASSLAQTKDRIGLPDDYSSFASDHFLTDENSDPQFAGYYAKVEEGVRFPPEATRDAQIGLLNPTNSDVMTTDYLMLPAYDLVSRLSVVGNDGGELAISQVPFQRLDYVKLGRTRTRVRYGPAFMTCTNSVWWAGGHYDKKKNIFYLDGDTFTLPDYPGGNPPDHTWIRAQQFWIDTWTEYYWDWIVVNDFVQGSVIAETFLNAQEGWMMAADLYFTRRGASGDVVALLCETNDSGGPDTDRVLAVSTVTAANLKLYPTATRFQFSPIALQAGKRYALVLVTAGNHFVALVTGNKYANGTLFTSTDAKWFQGDLIKDLAMQLIFARFRSPRTEVQMQPLQTSNGGITGIDILAETAMPQAQGGFSLDHQIQDPITGEWHSLNPDTPNHLIGQPAQLSYRVVFVGTTEMQPGLGVGPASRITCSRPADHFVHVSEIRDMPGAGTINTVQVKVRLEAWVPGGAAQHTSVVKVLTGVNYATVETYDAIIEEACEDDPENAIYRTYLFTLAGAVESYRLRIEGTTADKVEVFHVSERIDVGMTV